MNNKEVATKEAQRGLRWCKEGARWVQGGHKGDFKRVVGKIRLLA